MITVLTTTYNRANKLNILFQSLMKQDCKNFIWLIIDDGSTDDTEKRVEHFGELADFKINYKKKENGGKHTALNFSYQYIETELTFIVDSDDELTTDAISTILTVDKEHGNERDLCGYSFLRKSRKGGYLNHGTLPQNCYKTDYVTCRINDGLVGDMAEVWKTDCLREFLFPIFEGEKFLGEDLVWIKMAKKYRMLFFNKAIYISDYLDEGLTKNRRINNIKSPNGCMARAEAFIESNANLKNKIKAMLQYIVYGKYAGYNFENLYFKIKRRKMFVLLYPLGSIIFLRWKRVYQIFQA